MREQEIRYLLEAPSTRRSKLTREMQLYCTGKNNQTKPLRKIDVHLGSQTRLTFLLELLPQGAWREAALKQKPKLITGSFHTLWCFGVWVSLASADNGFLGGNTIINSVIGSLFHQI